MAVRQQDSMAFKSKLKARKSIAMAVKPLRTLLRQILSKTRLNTLFFAPLGLIST
jgi:hypothetical protein